MAHLSDLSTEHVYNAEIINSKRFTPAGVDEIKEITFEIEADDFIPSYNQSFGVLIDHENEFGHKWHHRLYTVSDLPEYASGKVRFKILVKRCKYVDDFSGEEHLGVASNYLCDKLVHEHIKITGPHSLPFVVPDDKTSDLILIGMGTGIAPFRAFVKNLYLNEKDYTGKIRLFYGAKSGLELIYLNEKDGDLTQYYDETTFKAFSAFSPRPHMNDPIALDKIIEERAEEILEMLNKLNTRIYVAGYKNLEKKLDTAFSNILGSEEAWKTRKAEMIAGKKWVEIIY